MSTDDDRSSSARAPRAPATKPSREQVEPMDQGSENRDLRPESEEAEDVGARAGEPAEETAAREPAANELRDRWLRAEADLQNYRRRAQRDTEESVRFAEDRLLLETIGHLDDLERALSVANEAGAPDPWVQGVQLVANRIRDDLARHDVAAMKPLGQKFDPELHEALLEVDAAQGAKPGEIVQVVREGYRRGGRALRAARVVVARRPEVA